MHTHTHTHARTPSPHQDASRGALDQSDWPSETKFAINSFATDTVRLFAWNARCETIRFTNCWARSTFDFSKELDRMDPKGWKASEMSILIRRVATYVVTGR